MSIKAACKPLNMGLQAALSLIHCWSRTLSHKCLTIAMAFAASKPFCLRHTPNTER